MGGRALFPVIARINRFSISLTAAAILRYPGNACESAHKVVVRGISEEGNYCLSRYACVPHRCAACIWFAGTIVQFSLEDLMEATVQVLTCARCDTDITGQRDGKSKRAGLCARCGRAERLSTYFKRYYQRNKDKILEKNRRWARENKERVAELRRIRLSKQPKKPKEPQFCTDCGTVVQRALRCRKCYVRNKYHTDAEYRRKRLITTKRLGPEEARGSTCAQDDRFYRDCSPAGGTLEARSKPCLRSRTETEHGIEEAASPTARGFFCFKDRTGGNGIL